MFRNLILSTLVVAPLCALGFSSTSYAQAGEGEGEGAAGEGEGEGAAGEGEGEGEGGGPVCAGGITITGDCNGQDANGTVTGNVVEFCGTDQTGAPAITSFDCGSAPFSGAQCGTVSAEWGVDCTVATGTCFFPDPTGQGLPASAFCTGGATAECKVTSATASACTNDSTQCSRADDDQCNGSVYTRCNFVLNGTQTDGQRTTVDCSVLGGTCTPGGAQTPFFGGCYSAVGQACTPNIGFCGTGPNDPNLALCPASGTCAAVAGEGEGEGGGGEGEGAAGGEGEGEGEGGGGGGCGCNTTSTGSAGFVALGLLATVMVRVKRKKA